MEHLIISQLFLTVLSLSLSGALIGFFLIALRPLTRKYFSAKWNYYIWLLVVVRLLLPFHFDSEFHTDIQLSELANVNSYSKDTNSDMRPSTTSSMMEHNSNTENIAATDNSLTQSHGENVSSPPADSTAASKIRRLSENLLGRNLSGAATAQKLLTAAAYLWFLAAIFLLFVKLVNYLRFKAAVKKNCVPITDWRVTSLKNSLCIRLHIQKSPALYESPSILGPLTIGLFRPVTILPQTADDERMLPQYQLILHHELIHVAKKDLLYKWIYQLLLCLHWFNPLLHCIGRQIDSDCELSCDEQILAQLTDTGRKLYGNVLLDTAEQAVNHRTNALATTFYTNKKDLKKRLARIVHYQRMSRFRLLLSACTLMIALTFTACGTIWISQEDYADAKEPQSEPDSDNDSIFSQIVTSMLSTDSFLDNAPVPSKSGDAWNAYEDDSLLAGNDNHKNFYARVYTGGNNKISASGFILYGTDSFLIAYADQEIDVRITTSFECVDGRFKVIYVAPDKNIITLNETGEKSTQTITMQKGRNVLKMVGQGAKLKNLAIDFSSIKTSKFESVFRSEEEEKIPLIKDTILSGKPYQKDEIMNILHIMEPAEASEIFHDMLRKGMDFTPDELQTFLIYSDANLSSQYLAEALQEGTIEPLSADTIETLMPYLEQEYCVKLLMTLPANEFYDVFTETIYYLDDSQIEACLNYYIDQGGVLNYSMFEKISPYLSAPVINRLDQKLWK